MPPAISSNFPIVSSSAASTSSQVSSQPPPAQSIVDFSSATPAEAQQSMGTSANLGKIVLFEGTHFYLKDAVSYLPVSPEMGNAITSREVASAKMYGLFLPAPEELMVNQCGSMMGGEDNKIYIASKLVSYQDFADCLIQKELADDLEQQFEEFTNVHAEAFKRNADTAKGLTDELCVLREKHSNWWAGTGGAPNTELVQTYRPRAEQLDEVMQAQIHLLPESLQRQMQEHLAVSQLLGDWDPINAFYKNMGIVKAEDGNLQVMRVDFGSCLDVGFQGQSKETGFDTAVKQRPAVFPELKNVFRKENATFSEKLPRLAEQFDDLPYADHAQSIAGKAEWADSTRMKVAYRCSLILKLRDCVQNPFETMLKENLIDTPELTAKNALIDTFYARMETLINEQCGASVNMMNWEKNQPELSTSIRADISSRLGIDMAPLST